MKIKRIIISALAGGVVGFGIHLIWHYSTGVRLFSFDPHIIQGTVFSIIGAIVGVVIWRMFSSK